MSNTNTTTTKKKKKPAINQGADELLLSVLHVMFQFSTVVIVHVVITFHEVRKFYY
jgi:cell division protein FtsB